MSDDKKKIYHAVVDGLTVPTGGMFTGGRVLARGDEITVTPELIDLTKDRNGDSWAADLSEDAQRARWGVVRFAPGPLADDLALSQQLAAERTAEAAAENQRRLLESRRYGSRHAAAYAASVEAIKAGELTNG